MEIKLINLSTKQIEIYKSDGNGVIEIPPGVYGSDETICLEVGQTIKVSEITNNTFDVSTNDGI